MDDLAGPQGSKFSAGIKPSFRYVGYCVSCRSKQLASQYSLLPLTASHPFTPHRKVIKHRDSQTDSASNMKAIRCGTSPFRQHVDNQQPVCRGGRVPPQLKNKSSATTRKSARMIRMKHRRHLRHRRLYEQLCVCSPMYCVEPGPSKPQSQRTRTNSTYDSALSSDPIVIPSRPKLTWLPNPWLKDTLICSFPPGFLPPHLTAQLAPAHDPDCPICCAPLDILSPYYSDPAVRARIDQDLKAIFPGVARHTSCGRTVHLSCFAQWADSCYYSSGEVTCAMCRGLLHSREPHEDVVTEAQTVESQLESQSSITGAGRWHWRIRGECCVQCSMFLALISGVGLLVVLGGLYVVSCCMDRMFKATGSIVLLLMSGLGLLLVFIMCVADILRRLLRLI